MQIQAKIGGILYNLGERPVSNYPDLEPDMAFWNRVRLQITRPYVHTVSYRIWAHARTWGISMSGSGYEHIHMRFV